MDGADTVTSKDGVAALAAIQQEAPSLVLLDLELPILSGIGNGRVYVVHFTATDDQGGSCNGTVKVAVPHSKKDTAVEGPQLHNSFGP